MKRKVPAKKEDKKLTGKQELFVTAYLANGFNGVRAAAEAGYTGNINTLSVQASANIRIPKIAKMISQGMDDACMSAREVKARLSAMAGANMADFIDDEGRVDVKALRRKGHIVKRSRVRSTTRHDEATDEQVTEVDHTIELHDSQAALEKMGRLHGLFTERMEVTGKDGAPFEFIVKVKESEMP